jgi:phenylacetic acid degradation operon negative regulatory protein
MTDKRKALAGGAELGRPLSARSVIASLLLRSVPPRMSGRRLVQWCELFGITEGTARVALSRMVERGELRASDGVYELAGRVRDRQPAQDFSLAPRLRRWTGEWRFAVVVAGGRSADDRSSLRDAMRRLRCAELREGVWTRPDNLPRGSATEEAWGVAHAQCDWWSGRPDDDPTRLATALFGPDDWARAARALVRQLERATAAVGAVAVAEGADHALAGAFVAGAGAVAHLRADPLLPAELCPQPWPGADLRRAYGAYERTFSAALRGWFRRH